MDICLTCSVAVTTEKIGLKCCFCSNHYHADCINIAKSYVPSIKKTNWPCLTCMAAIPKKLGEYNNLVANFKLIKAENDKLKKTVNDLQNSSKSAKDAQDSMLMAIESLVGRVTKLESRPMPTIITPDVQNMPQQDVKKLIHEYQDHQIRAKNIIIKRLPESNGTTVKDKSINDQATVRKIFDEVLNVQVNIVDVYRLGKGENYDRPLKVELDNKQQKMDIFKALREKKLTGTEYARITITDDYNKSDRETRSQLWQQMTERNQAGESLKLIGSKLVQRNTDDRIFTPSSSLITNA